MSCSSESPETTSGGHTPPWAYSGVNTKALVPGASSGPPADRPYALEPSGVLTTQPSPATRAYSVPSTSTRTRIWPSPARTTTMSLTAATGSPCSRTPSSAGSDRGVQSPAVKRSSARCNSLGETLVSTPRLPQATPSTGRPALHAGVDRRKRRSVAANRDDQAAVARVAVLGHLLLPAERVHLNQIDTVALRPLAQLEQRPFDRSGGMDYQADPR